MPAITLSAAISVIGRIYHSWIVLRRMAEETHIAALGIETLWHNMLQVQGQTNFEHKCLQYGLKGELLAQRLGHQRKEGNKERRSQGTIDKERNRAKARARQEEGTREGNGMSPNSQIIRPLRLLPS